MFNRRAFDNSRPDGIAVLEVPPVKPGGPRRFVPLQRTHLDGEVVGPLAALTVTHTFRYAREQCNQVLEALYRFPLPGDAAVTGVTVTFGEVEIRAELKERERAEQDYAEAKRKGKQAAIVSREAPDVFTLRVAGIHPDEDVTVETAYVQLAKPEGVGWSLRLPLTTAPRYTRGDEQGSPHAGGQPLALLRDPGHQFSLDLLVPEAATVESPTHRLAVGDEDGRTRVRLEGGRVVPDRDCVLRWRPRQEEARPALRVLTFDDQAGGYTYFLALVAPPMAHRPEASVAREVVLLKDVSGSMSGAKNEAANWAARKFLGDLSARDRLALLLFDDQQHWLARQTGEATRDLVARALGFLDQFPGGGTELGVALEQALQLGRFGGEQARHVLVITDAQVTDEGRILRLVEEEFRRSDRRRVSVLCIDAAPNSFLATEIAQRGGGVARFLTSSPEEDDIATALDSILADWAQPVLAGLRLEMNRPGARAAEREPVAAADRGWSAVDLGDLPAGRTVWVAGRVPRGEGPLRLRLRTESGVLVEETEATEGAPAALRSLFGARRLLGLEFLLTAGYSTKELAAHMRRLGYDPDRDLNQSGKEGDSLYAENTRREAQAVLGGLLLSESLAYGLLTSATAFVAVRAEAGKPVEGTVVVANALPSGWSDDFLSLSAPPLTSGSFFQAAGMLRRRIAPSGFQPLVGKLRASSDADEGQAGSVPMSAESMDEDLSRSIPTFLRREAPPARTPAANIFAGRPDLGGGETTLFDSDRPSDQGGSLPDRISVLRLTFTERTPDPASIDRGLELWLFVGDLASPRARVSLVDLVRQGGTRPLNLVLASGERVVLVLKDANGAWAQDAPGFAISLE